MQRTRNHNQTQDGRCGSVWKSWDNPKHSVRKVTKTTKTFIVISVTPIAKTAQTARRVALSLLTSAKLEGQSPGYSMWWSGHTRLSGIWSWILMLQILKVWKDHCDWLLFTADYLFSHLNLYPFCWLVNSTLLSHMSCSVIIMWLSFLYPRLYLPRLSRSCRFMLWYKFQGLLWNVPDAILSLGRNWGFLCPKRRV